MKLPPRRQKRRSGIERSAKREWPRHRKFVRAHSCVVPGCQDYPIEFAHVRSSKSGGTALKPHDYFAVSLCAAHHREQHQVGELYFEARYKIDLLTLACEFANRSPDKAMRDSLNPQREEGRDAGR